MSPRGRLRRGVAALATVVALAASAACGGSQPQAAPPPGPLRILLVNDDGWNAPGIVALRNALRQAGHRVVEIAPVADRSDSGTAASFAAPFQVRRPTPDRDLYAISGTAADATLVGVQAVMGDAWPDVVVAGINPERSVGLDTLRSGTVGAAMTAASLGFPALAVSTETADARRPRPDEFARAAAFTVRLVAALQQSRPSDGPMMPRRTVLNVNYPRGPETPRGISLAPTADASAKTVYYRQSGRNADLYVPTPTVVPAPGGDNDATVLSSGRVALTDLSSDPDRSAPPPRVAARVLPLLEP